MARVSMYFVCPGQSLFSPIGIIINKLHFTFKRIMVWTINDMVYKSSYNDLILANFTCHFSVLFFSTSQQHFSLNSKCWHTATLSNYLSLLSSLLLSNHILSLNHLIQSRGFDYYLYADGSQIYTSTSNIFPEF